MIFEGSHEEAIVPNVDFQKYKPLVNIYFTLAPRVADDRGFPKVLHFVLFRRDKLQLRTTQDLVSLRFHAADEGHKEHHIFMVYIVIQLIWMISWITSKLEEKFLLKKGSMMRMRIANYVVF